MQVTLAVQAGGLSNRMGQDKALLPFIGKPLIQYVVERGRAVSDDILVTARQDADYPFLGLPVYADRLPQRSALVGMHTALSAAARPIVAVIGCDMPFFNPRLLAYQVQLLQEQQVHAVVPRSRDGLEPLHGVYRREICLAAIQQALDRNIQSLHGWFGLFQMLEVPEEMIRAFDPQGRAFINLNTLADYQQAQALALADLQD